MPSSTNTSSTDRHHTGGEHLVQRVYVAGDAGDQTADRILVEERDVQALQMAKDLAAQIEHHLLPAPLHDVGLGELEQETEQQQANVHARDLGDAGERIAAEEAVKQRVRFGVTGQILVDGDFGEVRPQNIGAGFQHDGDQRHRDLPAIFVQIGEQAPHQPGVVCLA